MNGSIDLTRFTKCNVELHNRDIFGAVVAMKAFNIVANLNPYVALATAAALLGSYLYEVVNFSDRFKEIWENFNSGKIGEGD